MANIIFARGTKAQFDALKIKDANTLYWLSDVQQLWKGDVLYATGATATNLSSGLMSAEDKAKLDNLSAGGGALNLTAVDGTILIADGKNGKTIGVQISQFPGNALSKKDDGLFVSGGKDVEFVIERQGTAAESFATTYKLKRIEGGTSTYVGDEINIPKDLVIQSGTLGTVTEADQPYIGAAVGDLYIDLTLSDPASTRICLPASGIVDPVAGSATIRVEDNVVSVKIDSDAPNGLVAGEGGLRIDTATTTTAGAMSAEDKAALDTVVADIENIKGSLIWTDMA